MASPRPPGSFKIANQRRSLEYGPERGQPDERRSHRVRRIIDSIHSDLDQGGQARVRQIVRDPRELYRLELELPEMGYQRTTILDRETLAALLEGADQRALGDRFIVR